MLLRRLPYEDPGRLVLIAASNPKRGVRGASFSLGGFEYYRDHSTSFSAFAASAFERFNITGGERPEQVPAARVTFNFLKTLGVAPALGRDFLSEEDQPGGRRVALISHGLWIRRFGSDGAITGKTLILDDRVYSVIGVMPAGFDLPAPSVDIWVPDLSSPSVFTPEQIQRGAGYISLIARLRSGVSAENAATELTVAARQYQQAHPRQVDADPDARIEVQPLRDALVQDVRPALMVLSFAVGFVLLIACANVAGLLLARATGRSREIAIRVAMGASRRYIVRQLLTESITLALFGGVGGLLLAAWVTPLLSNLTQGSPIPIPAVSWDPRVLLFTLCISILTGLIFGLVPALRISNPDLNTALREQGRGSSAGLRQHRVRSLLIVGQVALSMVLLIGAGLLLRSFNELQRVNPGFDPKNVLSLAISLPASKYPDEAHRTAFIERTIQSIEALPGVDRASAVLSLPLTTRVFAPFMVEGGAALPFAQRPLAAWQSATPGYFETMRVHLIRGRTFTQRDRAGAPFVTVINESMARRLWPKEDPIGKRLLIARAELRSEVVGVIADVQTARLEADASLEMYTPYSQRTWGTMNLVVRTRTDPAQLANPIRDRILMVDPDEPVASVRTLEDVLSDSFGQRTVTLWLVGSFAFLALVLAVVGLYGVMSYSVAQRMSEMGIRRALGASSGQIRGLVLKQALRLALAGIALGIAGALALARLIAGLLFGVGSADPFVFAGTAVLFTLVALAGSYIPAWRAARVNPITALRCE